MKFDCSAGVGSLTHNRVVTDSKRIVGYIDETFSGPAPVPPDPDQAEAVDEFVRMADELDIRAVSYSKAPHWVTVLLTGMRPHLQAWYRRMKERPSFEEAEIWTRMRPGRMLPIMLPYLLPRLLAVAAVVSVVVWLLMWA